MKLRFKHQKFQADAAKAVVDVFEGQPRGAEAYRIDKGADGGYDHEIGEEELYAGWRNSPVRPDDGTILEHIQRIQRAGGIRPSPELAGRYNLTVEMETGVGKTYTYIKTMYELNRAYGWSKFIVVVPSVAIREGVYKSFQVTEEHFAGEYGRKIRFFIYNSARLEEIERFASDGAINAMIINAQAFNARGKDARRISMRQDLFRSRRPIDVIAATNPILIIDEPQSVEGEQTRRRLADFRPLFTLRYSATPKESHNLVYRMDALDAYNRRLVKKICVTGISAKGGTATEGYVYLRGINLSRGDPTASVEFDVKRDAGVRRMSRALRERDNLFALSGGLDEYRDGFIVKSIDGRDGSVEFVNGLRLTAGEMNGKADEAQLRRIQIRETILAHLDRERLLFRKGIKVLSLFFIDEVAKYRRYDEKGESYAGPYAEMFEEEYRAAVEAFEPRFGEEGYAAYLKGISAGGTHAGYFSVDKNRKTGRERFVDGRLADRRERTSDDADAYDLIMKDKERLLDLDEPVRFLFSHSALREGWDNPNVFQICTLKQSDSTVRKRQEVGRGMRLCVNRDGERMDENRLGGDVQNVNVLTVIASESYESFARGLQSEFAEAVSDRPREVTPETFEGQIVRDADGGGKKELTREDAKKIYQELVKKEYVDFNDGVTDLYRRDRGGDGFEIAAEGLGRYTGDIGAIIDAAAGGGPPAAIDIGNARSGNVEPRLDRDKLEMAAFKELWSRINRRSAYTVDFDTGELVGKCVGALNASLRVPPVYYDVETGRMESIDSKGALLSGEAFDRMKARSKPVKRTAGTGVRYDLIGRVVAETGLTRKAVAEILAGIDKNVFGQFRDNPEAFIIRASELINEQKAAAVIQHITYSRLDEAYRTDIFTEPSVKGHLGVNAMKTDRRHLYDYLVYDSNTERDFANDLETREDVAVYVKLPGGFYISTPVGKYHPDWAIAFKDGGVRHVYFVAETKGSMSTMQIRPIEDAKIQCARKHFLAISSGEVRYDVVSSYEQLLALVKWTAAPVGPQAQTQTPE